MSASGFEQLMKKADRVKSELAGGKAVIEETQRTLEAKLAEVRDKYGTDDMDRLEAELVERATKFQTDVEELAKLLEEV